MTTGFISPRSKESALNKLTRCVIYLLIILALIGIALSQEAAPGVPQGAPGPQSQQAIGLSSDLRPIPDPTEMTSRQLTSAIASVREILETRLDGMDKALELLQHATDRAPGIMDAKISQLQMLHEEKFASIATQFQERDTRTEQTSRDSKVAVDAALQAAKEAVGEQNKSSALAIAKSETGTTKQIDALSESIKIAKQTLDEKIATLSSRLDLQDGQAFGKGGAKSDTRETYGLVVATLVGVAGFITALLALFFKR